CFSDVYCEEPDQYSFIDLHVHVRYLILSEGKMKEKEAEDHGEKPRRTSGGRILIIDDEQDVTFFLKEALESYGGFEVTTFNDPLTAISSFDNDDTKNKPSAYDLILLDIKMPKMDGFELYQELQKRIDSADSRALMSNGDGRNEKGTKICFMTAFEVYFDALKELFPDSYSSMCFIKKPSSAQDLIKRVRKEMDLL
ncbi:MAG TPA: response regulator, partial [Nitrososphaera sp.]|nr:response regulator [Nitrososphaera sp.]